VRRRARRRGEVALSLERMVGVEEIDPPPATMTVLAGTPLERVQAAADDAGFLIPSTSAPAAPAPSAATSRPTPAATGSSATA
jgi:FAD/FMN-containing dehydrogenase